jgi:hypothetical protein
LLFEGLDLLAREEEHGGEADKQAKDDTSHSGACGSARWYTTSVSQSV